MKKQQRHGEREKSTNQSDQKVETGRRRVLAGVLAGGAVAGTAAAVPSVWTRPVVQSVLLPAHAQTSADDSDGQSDRPPEDGNFSGRVMVNGGLLRWLVPAAHADVDCTPQIGCATLQDGTLTIFVAYDQCCCYNGSGDLDGGSISLASADTAQCSDCGPYSAEFVELIGSPGSRTLKLSIDEQLFVMTETANNCDCAAFLRA